MAAFVPIFESIVAAMTSAGVDFDAGVYNPADVLTYMLPPSSPLGTRDDSRTTCHHLEIDLLFSTPMQALKLFLPATGTTLTNILVPLSTALPSPPPNPSVPLQNGDGTPPMYMTRPTIQVLPPVIIPNPGIALIPAVGAAIDLVMAPFLIPAPLKPVDPTQGSVIAAALHPHWLSSTVFLGPGRISAAMAAYDAAWIRFIANSFYI